MTHLLQWNKKIEKSIIFDHEYNSNITKKGQLKDGRDKKIWAKTDMRSGEIYFPSGNEWNREILASINALIYLCNIKYIIPYTDMINTNELEDLLNNNFDEETIKTKKWRNFNINNPLVEIFYSSLEVLLNEMEDGDEEHTNDVVKTFLNTLGVNRKNSPFVSESRHTFHFNVGGMLCITKPDIIVFWNQKGIVILFDENKRRIKTSSLQEFFSQIVCHSIGVAQNNIRKGKDQEVFGIAVKDKNWRFCHTIITQEYLNTVAYVENIPNNIFMVQKVSKIAYNICNPNERKDILIFILSILHYVFNEKPMIADW